MKRLLTAASRTTAVGGFVTFTQDQFGNRLTQYNEIPILDLFDLSLGDTVLPFTEANPGGGSAASTSIYAAQLGSDGVVGLQNAPPSVRFLGESDTTPEMVTRVDWNTTIEIRNPLSVARLNGIKTGAVVV